MFEEGSSAEPGNNDQTREVYKEISEDFPSDMLENSNYRLVTLYNIGPTHTLRAMAYIPVELNDKSLQLPTYGLQGIIGKPE